MENINLIKLLSQKNYIMYNKEIAHKIGIESAILLGAMCSYCNSFKNEEFYRNEEEIAEDTALTIYAIRKSKLKLQELGILKITKKGMPAKHWFELNVDNIAKIITSDIEITTNSSDENIATSGDEMITTSGDEMITTSSDEMITTLYNNSNYINTNNINNKRNNNKKEIYKEKSKVKDENITLLEKVLSENKFYYINEENDIYNTIIDWLKYKQERKEYYKETGLKILLKQINTQIERYNQKKVIDVINESMANNYMGITFDKLKFKNNEPDYEERRIF